LRKETGSKVPYGFVEIALADERFSFVESSASHEKPFLLSKFGSGLAALDLET
jgi:hypothetical protein